jgi:carboxylate-amine ligase
VLTVGVEEEFLLMEPGGALAPVAGEVVAATADGQLMPELMAYQVETASRPCEHLADLRSELVRLRLLAARGAARAGARLVAAGLPPFRSGAVDAITAHPRYLEIARRFPVATAAAGGACSCQVHVGMPDRALGIQVLARLRPWLPALLAMTANSAVVDAGDSGWHSTRYRMLRHWPTFRPPEVWASVDAYDRTVRAMIDRGAALDAGGIYLLARLSARYPTVEVRVADSCPTVDDALLLAAVVRALVATLMREARLGLRDGAVTQRSVDDLLLDAARYGTTGPGPVPDLPALLIAKVMPALREYGDADLVAAALDRLWRVGTGADRQRALWVRSPNRRAFVAELAESALPDHRTEIARQ